jgi:ATP-dependent 26S proteasome regulatory subunit
MYALRERRQHVTQEDFEFAVAKVRSFSFNRSHVAETDAARLQSGTEEESGGQH